MTAHRALVLELDLSTPPHDRPADPWGRVWGRAAPTLGSIVAGLERAGGDRRVRALVVKLGGTGWHLARAQELREAVLRFRRRSGRPAVAWAESFGDFTGGSIAYLLATGFDQIWLQPSGDLGLTGVAVEVDFLAGTLERLGVEPQLGQRYEYKSAADRVTRRGFTPAHREAVARLAASAAEQIVDGVAQARDLPVERVRELVDAAPLSAADALAAGLVDRLGYRDEVYDDVRRRAGAGGQLLFLARYAQTRLPVAARWRHRNAPRIALVEAHGTIHSGRSRSGRPGRPSIGSDTVAAALRAAVAAGPAAVVLRIDSPGGSAVASDVIWRAVTRVRAAGLPVVASMGAVAASGGYFAAMGADAIVAQPGTLTGSIGVFGGKAVLTGLLARLGVDHDAVSEGRHARMFSTRRGFTGEERELLEQWLDRIYTDFTGKVAQSRGLTDTEVDRVARGRVWTGADASRCGLVDDLGGVRRAVEVACARVGADPDRVRLVRMPHRRVVDRLHRPRSSEDPAAAAAGWGGFSEWGSVGGLARRLGLPATGPLLLPDDVRLLG